MTQGFRPWTDGALVMNDLIREYRPIGTQVKHFWCDKFGYWALTHSGLRLDMIRARNLQPPIQDKKKYYACMIVQTDRSFYLLTQAVIEDKAQPWVVEAELEPVNPRDFFFDFVNYFMENRDIDWLSLIFPQLKPFEHDF